MPNKKKRAGLSTTHTAIEHRQRGPRRAQFVASNCRIKQLIDHYYSDCSDWEDAADGATKNMTPTLPPPPAVPAPAKTPSPKPAPAPEPTFEFNNFTKLIQFLKECAIRYISTITKGKLKFEMNEITITITKNSVERHASEHERFKVTFAVCMEETHTLPEDIREFFESAHCNTPITKITHDSLITRRVCIYSLAVDGFGKDIYIASDTAVNNFLLKMKSFEDNKKQFALPTRMESWIQDSNNDDNITENTANASPITVESCLDGFIDNEDDALPNIKVADAFMELSQMWN